MKKLSTLIFLTVLCIQSAFSQAGWWTWISGSNQLNAPGVFGTKGVPSVNNYPPASYGFLDWKDKQGNFWVFHGWTTGHSDLWKFNPSTLEWTWVNGNGTTNHQPFYGTRGVPSPSNHPGSRISGVPTWVDTTGNLWLFGGSYRNDLWRYDIGTDLWTWMSGDTVYNMPGIHGTQGVPNIQNIPGARVEVTSAWCDADNNLYMFGGLGFDDNGTSGQLNDLVRYNTASGEWTWMNGSPFVNGAASYGTKGVPAPTNIPGARYCYNKWKDKQGNLWMMGGHTSASMNDMWRYAPLTNDWTWMAGPATPSDAGAYLSNCVFDSLSRPRSRFEHRSGPTDNCGRFWLFGGAVYNIGEHLNDLWVFYPDQLKWNWAGGSNVYDQPSVYGTQGVPAPTNIPSGRAGAAAWWGDDNRFYMFAGTENPFYSPLADMWVFTPDTACTGFCADAPPAAIFTAPHHICPGTCTDFTNLSTNANAYQWTFPGGSPSTSTDVNPQVICYYTPGIYDVTLIATGPGGSDTLTLPNYLTVFPFPPVQSISQNGDTLFCNTGFTAYQWFFGGDTIPGATNYYYLATQSGNYSVIAVDGNGCFSEAVAQNVIAEVKEDEIHTAGLLIFPNPANTSFIIESPLLPGAEELIIYNTLGEIIYNLSGRTNFKSNRLEINCRKFPAGVLWIEVKYNAGVLRSMIIKE